MTSKKQRALQILLPIVILALGVGLTWYLYQRLSPVEKAPPPIAQAMPVEVQALQRSDYQVVLESFGTIKPRTQSTLVAQISGVIKSVSDAFRNGGTFKKGDLLVAIDDSDYRIALKSAEAPLLRARALLAEEQARAKQARDEWQSLQRPDKPNPLVLREPQIAAAEAEVLAAEASLQRAQLDLQRTRIFALYDGRTLRTSSSVGQFVSIGTPLAELFSTDVLEVQLPLSQQQLQYLDLNALADSGGASAAVSIPVRLDAGQGAQRRSYQGRVVRTQSEIDNVTRQLSVIAAITTPVDTTVGASEETPYVGQFVRAYISAQTLQDVFVIPEQFLLQGNEVLLAVDGLIERRAVEVLWRDDKRAIIGEGLQEDELLIVTVLGNAISGTRIRHSDERSE